MESSVDEEQVGHDYISEIRKADVVLCNIFGKLPETVTANLANHAAHSSLAAKCTCTYDTCSKKKQEIGVWLKIRKQNVTVSLSVPMVHKARVLAAKRSTSISALLAEQIESLVNEDDIYKRAAASAIARMKRGFHLGEGRLVGRDELHERY